jgi:L-fuculose-phosphate aldolase
MLLENQRTVIVEFGKQLVNSSLTTGAGGNLSCMDRAKNLIAISPSGIDYDELLPEDVVVLNTNGEIIDGKLKPSSETGIHLGLYRARQDISAIIHTHSPYATTMACLNMKIPAIHYLVGFSGNHVPVAPYATFGTEQLAKNVSDNIGEFNAVLMANHGLIAVGVDLLHAFCVAEEIEFVARIYYQAKSLGKPAILSDNEMEKVIKKFANYGQRKKKI